MNYIKSHLVSQVLLRRFANRKYLKIHYKFKQAVTYKRTDGLGYIEFPQEIIQFSEDKWSRIEYSFGLILQRIDDGSLLENDESKKVIKKFMALHYVRSAAFIKLLKERETESFLEFIDKIKKEYPDKEDEINSQFLLHRQEWLKYMVKIYPKTVNDLIKKVKKYIMAFDIEIGAVHGANNFLLSDNPVITITKDKKVGIISGAVVNESEFLMPLGPKHVAALTSKENSDEYRLLTNSKMKKINRLTKQQAINEYYSTPELREVKKYLKKDKKGKS